MKMGVLACLVLVAAASADRDNPASGGFRQTPVNYDRNSDASRGNGAAHYQGFVVSDTREGYPPLHSLSNPGESGITSLRQKDDNYNVDETAQSQPANDFTSSRNAPIGTSYDDDHGGNLQPRRDQSVGASSPHSGPQPDRNSGRQVPIPLNHSGYIRGGQIATGPNKNEGNKYKSVRVSHSYSDEDRDDDDDYSKPYYSHKLVRILHHNSTEYRHYYGDSPEPHYIRKQVRVSHHYPRGDGSDRGENDDGDDGDDDDDYSEHHHSHKPVKHIFHLQSKDDGSSFNDYSGPRYKYETGRLPHQYPTGSRGGYSRSGRKGAGPDGAKGNRYKSVGVSRQYYGEDRDDDDDYSEPHNGHKLVRILHRHPSTYRPNHDDDTASHYRQNPVRAFNTHTRNRGAYYNDNSEPYNGHKLVRILHQDSSSDYRNDDDAEHRYNMKPVHASHLRPEDHGDDDDDYSEPRHKYKPVTVLRQYSARNGDRRLGRGPNGDGGSSFNTVHTSRHSAGGSKYVLNRARLNRDNGYTRPCSLHRLSAHNGRYYHGEYSEPGYGYRLDCIPRSQDCQKLRVRPFKMPSPDPS